MGAFFNPKHDCECQGKVLADLARVLAAELKMLVSLLLVLPAGLLKSQIVLKRFASRFGEQHHRMFTQ